MNPQLILTFVALRYRLLWAAVRSRNGKIALLALGWVLLSILLLSFLLGGFNAARIAVESRQSRLIARTVLGGLFLSATFVGVFTGWGIQDAFSDAVLRRYPLNARGRLAVRHLTGILDPLWLLIFTLESGLAVGMSVFGGSSFRVGLTAVVILVLANYLLARELVCTAAGLIRFRIGKLVLVIALFGAALPALLIGAGWMQDPRFLGACSRVLRFCPPFLAADLIVPGTGSAPLTNISILLLWLAGLMWLLPALERWSSAPATTRATGTRWRGRYDRVASLFGPQMAPWISKSLRYYFRYKKIGFMCLAVFVIFASQLAATPVQRDPRERFLLALCLFTLAGTVGPLPLSTNQFGYEALSFRRYRLSPISLAMIMRANSCVSLLLGGAQTLLLVLLWIAFAPMVFDVRMPIMLLASGTISMFLFNAIAVWTSLLAPRAADYELLVDFNVSVAGAVLLHGFLWPAAIGGQMLRAFASPDAVLTYWWVSIPAIPISVAVYIHSVGRAATVLPRIGERLMNRLEGRD